MILLAMAVAVSTGAGPSPADAARGVLTRLMGERARELDFQLIAKEDGCDIFTLEARDSKMFVARSSGVALCRGAYHDLRHAGLGMRTWYGQRLALPEPLPDFPKTRIKSPHALRLYYNACTFAYTTAFWDWPQYFDGQGWENKLARKYGVQSIPATFLLDREGKIIAEDLRGAELEAAVAKAVQTK